MVWDAALRCLDVAQWATEGVIIGASRPECDMMEPQFWNNLLRAIARLVLGVRQEASFLREGESGSPVWEVLGTHKGVHSPYVHPFFSSQ